MIASSPTHVLASLAKLLEKEEPKVAIVVGAGVSLGATGAAHAGWQGLLKHGIEHLVHRGAIPRSSGDQLQGKIDTAFSAPFDLASALQHAELIEKILTTPDLAAFDEWLRSAFKDFRANSSKVATLEAIRDLQLAGAVILTTNYDSLLSDVTGLPPVTWEEPVEFLQVIQGRRHGILHIHGHWMRPSSVVLGRGSYDRVVSDQRFQDLFKSLWLEWSWLYVGCGDGLDDPNLGRLLEWGKQWGEGAWTDYFLARMDKAAAIAARSDKPRNLESVGYTDHSELPVLLRSITPAERCSPFVRVDDDSFHLFRRGNQNIPFPSRQEYLNGEVPSFSADKVVEERLDDHKWAVVLDVASVGKTTLALRVAHSPAQHYRSIFYLDLAEDVPGSDVAGPSAALHRLSRPGVLLILDNAHHRPELTRLLWNRWREYQRGSRLLIVATRIQKAAVTTPNRNFSYFEFHAANRAIQLRPTPIDLERIAAYIYQRVRNSSQVPELKFPFGTAIGWHRDFGAALAAFVVAVTRQLPDFKRGHWNLPLNAAADWVRDQWLTGLEAQEIENLLCLAAFGAQELELPVYEEALPYPGKTESLLKLGLVARTDKGPLRQCRQYSLREPGWGGMILAAVDPRPTDEALLFDAAIRFPIMAVFFNARLRSEKLSDVRERFWTWTSERCGSLIARLDHAGLATLELLLREASAANRLSLVDTIWTALESDLSCIAERAWNTPLHITFSFLRTAKAQGRATEPMWIAIESEPSRLADVAWATPFGQLTKFFESAEREGRNIEPILNAFVKTADRIAEVSSLSGVHGLLEWIQKRDMSVEPFWTALKKMRGGMAQLFSATSATHVATFLNYAKRHGWNVQIEWHEIQSNNAILDSIVRNSSLEGLSFFIRSIAAEVSDINTVWVAIENDQGRIVDSLNRSHFAGLAQFLRVSQFHGRDVELIWKALEQVPGRLASRALKSPVNDICSFLETAKEHGRNVGPFWAALEDRIEELGAVLLKTPLDQLCLFIETTNRHERDVTKFWEVVEKGASKLACLVWEAPLYHIGSFLTVARKQRRNVNALCTILENDPNRLATKGLSATVGELAAFQRSAPDMMLKAVLRDIRPGHWDHQSAPLVGASWLAWGCRKANRTDLEHDLIILCLRRSNWRDFPPQSGGFGQVAWVLANVPPAGIKWSDAFMDSVCRSVWLKIAYEQSAYVSLATGLCQWALYQPWERVRRLHDKALGIRIGNALAKFKSVSLNEQFQIIQLIGCASLCGWPFSSRELRTVLSATISQALVAKIVHRAEATKVEDTQFRVLVGLRVFASVTGQGFVAPIDTIRMTHNLWCQNYADSLLEPPSNLQRLNLSMMKWLDFCLRQNISTFAPSDEPVSAAIGFPTIL